MLSLWKNISKELAHFKNLKKNTKKHVKQNQCKLKKLFGKNTNDKWKNLMTNEKISRQMKKSHEKWKNLMTNEKISWQMKKSHEKWKNLMTNEKIWSQMKKSHDKWKVKLRKTILWQISVLSIFNTMCPVNPGWMM